MKKNISINISGIIFHIEEDGYDKLKSYLDSINKYFSAFDDSSEIIADIESRIAEIFLTHLSETKQVITLEDVESLMATMGSIEDFQAIEDSDPDPFKIEDESASEEQSKTKRLFRDSKRKIIGGVASGIAYYFSIDPLWIRLIFIVLAFDLFITTTISGVTILGYIILWIVLPDSADLSEDKKLKKMYRNPDDRVIGGVASGVAAYFGVDIVIIRILFILSIFLGGTGIIVYVILWIILPEANTITEKVQMKGEPVTLENIESNIKSSLNVKDTEEESTLVRILLFPFRIIATVVKGLGKALGPILLFLVDFIRVAFGVVLTLMGISSLITLAVLLGVSLGVIVDVGWLQIELPIAAIREAFPLFALFAAFLAGAVPSIGFILLGITIISKGAVGNATIGWTLFALWILSLIVLSFFIPKVVYEFKAEGIHREIEYYDVSDKTAIITINEIGMDDYENGVDLEIRGYEGDTYKLVQEFEAHGKSRKDAIENAQMVTYNMMLDDSVFIFDSNIKFKDQAKFRAQTLDMILYVPYYSRFQMTYELRHILKNTIYRNGYSISEMGDNIWQFTPDKLECLTCEDLSAGVPDSRSESGTKAAIMKAGGVAVYQVDGFRTIEVQDNFLVKIEKDRRYQVILKGEDDDIRQTIVRKDDDLLIVRRKKQNEESMIDIDEMDQRVEVLIHTPYLDEISLSGASKARVNNFDCDEMNIKLSGVSDAVVHSEIKHLEAVLSGATRLVLEGSGETMKIEASGVSHVNGSEFQIREAEVTTKGAATTRINAERIIETQTSTL